MKYFKRTKIIATLGPASQSAEMIEKLMRYGVNVFRLNCSHRQQNSFKPLISLIRQCAEQAGVDTAILADLQGPKIRTGKLKNGAPIFLESGKKIQVTSEDIQGTADIIAIPHPEVLNDLQAGDTILIADGIMKLHIDAIHNGCLTCTVIEGGQLEEHKGVNFPGAQLKISALTQKDKADLAHVLTCEVDYVALSFVRKPSDITLLRKTMGAENQSVKIIAKIEKPEAIDAIQEIIEVSDGIMIARGDLGVELPIEKIPLIQKKIINYAHFSCKPVIVATQMMESMITHWRPTRAEVTDVANAVLYGSDVCMLSGETAMGKYPDKTVEMMSSILCEVELDESCLNKFDTWNSVQSPSHSLARSACRLAKETGAKAIVTFTISGTMALLVSKHRPHMPIFGLSPDRATVRRMSLYWGVCPVQTTLYERLDELLKAGKKVLSDKRLLNKGDRVVVIAGSNPVPGGSSLIKLDTI